MELSGIAARVFQHEYDHIEGVLFTDKLSSLKKRLIKGRLTNISKGKINVDYRMKFPLAKKKR
jgi:peptide deformylase